MQQRHALRFESGERRGETLPIPAGGLSLGRRPGNSVQVVDASVSGRHAEIEVRGGEVVLRDLGSTNGTRVGGERISERRLAHGDEVLLGNVKLTFLDRSLDEGPSSDEGLPLEEGLPLDDGLPLESPVGQERSTPVPAVDVGDRVRSIAVDRVERSRSRSLLTFAGVVLILAIGAAAWWWLGRRGPGQTARAARAVEPVAGNLLEEGYSFEQERGRWEGDERSPAGFEVDPSARRSGEVGLRAELGDGAGDWALARSPQARLTAARGLIARGWLRAEDGAAAALGVQFESSDASATPLVVWSDAVPAGEEAEVELALAVPPVFDRASALLVARLDGSSPTGAVDADDVSLVVGPAPAQPLRVDEFEVYALGTPARAVSLVKIGRALLGFDLCAGPHGVATPRVELVATVEGSRARIAPSGPSEGPGRTLALGVEPALASQGVASTGLDGYRVHQTEFDREGVVALLLGSGRDLVRVDLGGSPVRVRGRPDGGGFRIEAQLGPEAELGLQLAFREERATAQELAADARQAESEDRIGEALDTWRRVLDDFPYEAALVTEAAQTRSRLEQQGLEELRWVRIRLERARFFRLVGVFRRCRDSASAVAQGYAPSDVADEGQALLEEIEGELAVLERELDRSERARLVAIERALRAQGAEQLAARVRERLEARFGANSTTGEGD